MNKLIKIPHGNTVSVGAIEACLQATNAESRAPFTSRHVFMKLIVPALTGQNSQHEFGPNRALNISTGDIVDALQGSIVV
jgi:hypothetical protein